jgi:hypothetical protein
MVIDASPTKDFFIQMLTRDISLRDAIIDLVDNCVDGSLRTRNGGRFDDLWVRIEVSQDRFMISDNCGGISAELAKKYAFHFGRPQGTEAIPHSVGQFGVGMKRSLFKLGRKFVVESTSSKSHFVVDVDVDEWRRREQDWTFRFKTLDETDQPDDKVGTAITVERLNEGVATDLSLENFRTQLAETIGAKQQQHIENGLIISLNGLPVDFKPAELLSSDDLHPAFRQLEYPGKVSVKIWAGIIRSDKPRDERAREAGWYVFCNGRMILKADQTITTGWGERGAGQPPPPVALDESNESKDVDSSPTPSIPKYHPQFSAFRGYVFLDCDDGKLLPWTTTKTGIDADSPVYKAVRLVMITLMRPVIDFLNKLDAEKETEGGPLTTAFQEATHYKLVEVESQQVFTAPEPRPVAPTIGHITYYKPIEEINLVKKALNVYYNKDVGEKTFEYFLRMEYQR